ncbi:MAG: hypothetical protein JNL55_03220 [Steroidobacter sp.]|nr:hypothetical protein [Steroidobacter sp.]
MAVLRQQAVRTWEGDGEEGQFTDHSRSQDASTGGGGKDGSASVGPGRPWCRRLFGFIFVPLHYPQAQHSPDLAVHGEQLGEDGED